VDQGADVNTQSVDGQTALSIAKKNEFMDVVDYLKSL